MSPNNSAFEAHTLDFVFEHTTIPVPRVRRVLDIKNEDRIIIMDYIKGRHLALVWHNMSLLEKLRVGLTLRHYVRQLREIRHPRSAVPGPVAPDGPRLCMTPLFGDIGGDRGPFATYAEFSSFMKGRQYIAISCYAHHPVPPEGRVPFDESAPFVMTHQDINMRNVMVGDDGRLWLIDWAFSGFYPRWFEFVSMKEQCANEEFLTGKKAPLWDWMVPLICGPYYYRQERWLQIISPAFAWA
ncbi:hypothetical protein H0H81_001381 [Sphagnurus paluster]|uniref:Aminoglycoside phosphotransferase domain-containing protein n=1 Tax=Sphagnurus paluster TaxID=117069 RepID=A0A9P7FT19_9AGAR|nr:hypothetical protein H0H81_001381 [Sphagnurus paluster]